MGAIWKSIDLGGMFEEVSWEKLQQEDSLYIVNIFFLLFLACQLNSLYLSVKNQEKSTLIFWF